MLDHDYYERAEAAEYAREARAILCARARLAELRRMHPSDPDFDPDELDALDEALED